MFSPRLRDALLLTFTQCIGRYDTSLNYMEGPFRGNELWNLADETLRKRSDEYHGFRFQAAENASDRVRQYFARASDAGFVDAMDLAVAIVAACAEGLHRETGEYELHQFRISLSASAALEQMDELLRSEGTVFRIGDGSIFVSTDDFTHQEAVMPALHALSHPGFENALREFHEALAHHRSGEFGDVLTKANHAFESTMKVIATKMNWAYAETDTASKLIAVMVSNGLFPSMRESALGALRTLLKSDLPALRNKTPSAGHGAGTRRADVPESIATYAITVAAANIRLLVTEWRRLS